MANARMVRLWVSQTMPGLYFAETHQSNELNYGRPVALSTGQVLPQTAIQSMYSLNPHISFVEAAEIPEAVSGLLAEAGITASFDLRPAHGLQRLLHFLQHLVQRLLHPAGGSVGR